VAEDSVAGEVEDRCGLKPERLDAGAADKKNIAMKRMEPVRLSPILDRLAG
jgi:hypothetical protein